MLWLGISMYFLPQPLLATHGVEVGVPILDNFPHERVYERYFWIAVNADSGYTTSFDEAITTITNIIQAQARRDNETISQIIVQRDRWNWISGPTGACNPRITIPIGGCADTGVAYSTVINSCISGHPCPPYSVYGGAVSKSIYINFIREPQQYIIKLSLFDGASESGTVLTSVEPGKSTNLIARVYDQNNQLVPNVNVELEAKAKEDSGGHKHGDNSLPLRTGTLSSKDTSAVVSPDRKVMTGNTGPNGLPFDYKAPDIGGDITLTAKCIDKTCAPQGPSQVWVGVKSLTTLYPSEGYVLIGETGIHPKNHYLTNEAIYRIAVLTSLWRQFLARLFPETDFMLHLNDASLERGGIFDTRNNWKAPHAEHCRGSVIDIRANDAPGAIPNGFRKIFEKFAKSVGADPRWEIPKDENGNRRLDLRHYHVRLMGQEGVQCP